MNTFIKIMYWLCMLMILSLMYMERPSASECYCYDVEECENHE